MVKRGWKTKALLAVCLSLALLSAAVPLAPVPAHAAAVVTLDAPEDGAVLLPGIVTFSGTYAGVYDVRLLINGETQAEVVMVDPDQDDAGTWHYELDASRYAGRVIVSARGTDAATRYGVWSRTVTLHVDNPDAADPDVTIASPADGDPVSGVVPIVVQAQSAHPIEAVYVRLNGGPWQEAAWNGSAYVRLWDTSALAGDRTVAVEAMAVDASGRTGRSMTTYAKIGAGANEPTVLTHQDRAMWIWEPETYKLLMNPNARLVLDAFARDTETFGSEPVRTFYLAVGLYNGMDMLEDDPGKLREFIAWAHERGYRVHACIAGGTTPPYLGAYEAFHDKAIREIERIINYNLAAAPNERFDGVNVDIEPYISEDFHTQYPSLQLQYLDGLAKMIARIRTAGINLPFGPAIPKWYDSSPQAADITWNGQTKWLSEHILDMSDYIAIMDYRDTADGSAGIIAGATDEIAYANRIGKSGAVVIGVETKDVADSGDPEAITFREEGRAVMEAELDKVYAAFAGDASFGGIAMHHYDDLLRLPSHWGEDGIFWQAPADVEPPGALQAPPAAQAGGHDRVHLRYGMAVDNYDVDRYIIYRGAESGFVPDAAHIAGTARGLAFTDVGLLPDTTYFYRVAAVDLHGNIGPISDETAATTESTDLRPMILIESSVSDNGNGTVTAAMRLVDMETRQSIAGAAVEGRFHYAGGRYVSGTTDADGWVRFVSEAIPAGHQVGFEPRRVKAPGYYWAKAYDEPRLPALYPRAGLMGLELSAGSLEPAFSSRVTAYTAEVPRETGAPRLTATAAKPGSVIRINGEVVADGRPSPPVPLSETGETVVAVEVFGPLGETDVYTVRVARSVSPDNIFPVLEDTFVYEHEPEANFGAAEQLDIVDLPRAQGGGDRLAYLKFAFDGYDEPVQAAELRFRVTEDPAAPITLTVYGLASDDWSEHTMNWNNRVRAEETAIGTVRVAAAGWYKLDVTAYVQAQAAADDVATFRIMDPNTRGVLVQLAGKESGSAASHLVLNPSSNAQLRTLALDRGKLHPVFDGDVTAYTARVAYAVEAVSIAAEAEDARATVKVNGSPLAPGGISAPIPLQVGDNAIAVTVEAQDGTVSVYTVVVTRLANFVFEPADDTYVDENAPEESFGTAATLEVVDIPRAAGGGDRMAYLKFALDTMAEPVYSAVLHLYADEDPSAPVTLTVAGIPDDGWDERTMNWNNRISAGAVNVGTIRVASAGWHRLDVTAFVQSQMASDRTVTFRLMDPNTTNIGVSFRSGEHEANRPLLELNPGGITTQTYSPPVLRGPVHGNAPGRP